MAGGRGVVAVPAALLRLLRRWSEKISGGAIWEGSDFMVWM